jgi:NADH dehydrogenase FAD-containing subunit
MNTHAGRHRVVVIGAGFGGLFASRALRGAPVDLTVVDRTNHHLFQPLLYQVATGVLSEGEIAPPIRDVLRRQRNARVMLGEVKEIDLDAGDAVLPSFPERLRRRARRDLERLGVEVGLGAMVTGVDAEGLDLTLKDGSSDRIEARAKVHGEGARHWAARMGDVAVRPPDLPDRVQEPRLSARELGSGLPWPRTRRAHDHPEAGARPDEGSRRRKGRRALARSSVTSRR